MGNKKINKIVTPETIAIAKQELKLYMAYIMGYVRRSECREVIMKIIYQSSEQSQMLDDMVKAKELLEHVNGQNIRYTLPTEQYLDLLWSITPEAVERFKHLKNRRRVSQYYWNDSYNELRDFLLWWKFNNEFISYDWSDVNQSYLLHYIVRDIAFHPEWSKILQHLGYAEGLVITEKVQLEACVLLNLELIAAYKRNIIDVMSINPLISQSDVNASYLLFSHILPGRIVALSAMPSSNSCHYFASQAISFQYAKNNSKSIVAWRKVIKAEGGSGELMRNPLYSLLYVKALSSDIKQSSVNRLDKVDKFLCSLDAKIHIATHIFLDLIKERSCTRYVNYITESWETLTPIDLVLSTIVIRHYNIAQLPETIIRAVEEWIDHDEFLLLQAEASASLPKCIGKREELCAKLKVAPIFEKYIEIEPWEKSLNDLGDILIANNIKINETKSTTTSDSRIIYLLDNYDNFTPRLQRSKNGTTWSKGRNVALSTLQSNGCEGMTAVDKAVATCVRSYDMWSGRSYTLSGVKVYQALVGHPLVFCESNPDVSVSIVSDSPYIKVENRRGGFKVTSNVEDLNGSSNTLIMKESDVLYRVISVTSLQRRILDLFKKQSIFPTSAKDMLAQLLVDTAPIITIHSDIVAKNEKLKSIKGSTRITVQLLPISDGIKVELLTKPIEDFTQYCRAGEGQESFIAQYGGESILVERNLKAEKKNFAAVNKIIEEVAGESPMDNILIIEDIYDSLPLIERLQEAEKIARIEWPKGAKLKIRGAVDFSKLNLSMRSCAGWFEVDGDVKVDKALQITLAELLERNRESKGRFVELTKGEFIALSESLRRHLNALDASLVQNKKRLQLSQFSSGIVTSMEDDGVKVKKDTGFSALQTRIAEAERCEVTIPSTLQAELRDYQIDGYKWMSRLAGWGAGACLADDMGLGKTVQSIAVLLNRAERGASLIVAPASVVHNWQSELQRFSPLLKCHILHDNITEREAIVKGAESYDVVITTYGLLNRVTEIITAKEWNVILLDEAHNIKNRDTKSSKVAMNLTGEFRLILTGTPIQNHLGEIWNLFNFTNPGLLGSFDSFNQKFITPIEQNGDKGRQRELKRMLQPFMLRRTKSEVLDELPTKTEIIHRIELSDTERALYENIRIKALEGMESGALNPIQSLAEITKLRQAACHPALIDSTLQLGSSKTSRFVELVTELIDNRHRALVFSQFTSFLSLIKESLDAKGIPYLYLDGSTPLKEREKLVQSFQRGESPLFLISLKAGGVGLNLTAADYVIHLDPWWNPAIEDQASDRSHRIGQTRPVTIYRLIAQDTIEEKIIELHRNKRSLADSLLEGTNLSHKLSREDMLALLNRELGAIESPTK
ncbi:MAG: DEAD/DEAH box helicase [Rikenellaceae bacterium]